MNEPKLPGQPVVGSVTGSSGSLTIKYPQFCGVIQADVLLGPAAWRYKFGFRRQINTCVPTPPGVAPADAMPTPSGGMTAALPFTDATDVSPVAPATGDASTGVPGTGAAQLPFTGMDLQTLFVLGASMVALGLSLLSTIAFHRRMLRRASWWFFGL